MQFIPFCLFFLCCGYSMVTSAPINQTTPDTQESKQQKAVAIAHRLLEELAGEQVSAHHKGQVLNNDESKVSANRPAAEKVESHIVEQNDDALEEENNDEEYVPTLEDLKEYYSDKYAQLVDENDDREEESSSEMNEDDVDVLPISAEQLMEYLAEQEESDEYPAPVVHTPVMADNIMTAENHRRRRRRSVY